MTDLAAEPLARQYVRGQPTPIDNPADTLMRHHYEQLVAERLAKQQPAKLAAPVRLAVSDEDVRRAYYESAGYTMWITSMQLDPLQLMVCDDASGKYYRVPISLSGDKFDFGDPVEVAIEYKDVSTPAGAKAAASTVVWTSRAASVALDHAEPGEPQESPNPPERPPAGPAPTNPPAPTPAPTPPAPSTVPRVDPAAGAALRGMAGAPVKPPAAATPAAATTTNERLSNVDGIKMREALGLATDASDEELWAAIAAAQPTPEPAPEAVPDAASVAGVAAAAAGSHGDMLLVDRSQIVALQASARKGELAWQQLRTSERDQVLKQAMSDGKFPPARRDHYQKLWDADPEGTRALVAALAPNLIPTSLSGHMGSDEAASEAAVAYDALYGKAV